MLSLFSATPSLNVGIAPASAARATTSMLQARAVKATPLPASVKPGVVTGQALVDLLEHAKENQYAIPAVNVVSSCSIAACLEAAKEYGGPMIIQFSRGGGQFICGKAADNTDDAACIAGTVAVRASRFPNAGSAPRLDYHASGRSPRAHHPCPLPTPDLRHRISCHLPHTLSSCAASQGALHTRAIAAAYGVPVILHTDHCQRSWLPWFDGLMDANEEYYKKNGEPLFSSHMLDLSEEPLEENVGTCVEYLTRMAKSDILLEMELGVTGGEEDGVDNSDVDSSKL